MAFNKKEWNTESKKCYDVMEELRKRNKAAYETWSNTDPDSVAYNWKEDKYAIVERNTKNPISTNYDQYFTFEEIIQHMIEWHVQMEEECK